MAPRHGSGPFAAGAHVLRVAGRADPDTVWRRYAEPARWTGWAPHLTSVRASSALIAPGTTGVVTALGVVPARFVVHRVDERARQWSWTVTSLGLRLDLDHAVTCDPAGAGTVATLEIRGPHVVVAAYAPVARRALRRLVAP